MAFSPKLLQMGASGAGSANYIEDVFSTYLYTGNSSTQTITNGIDLAGKGGLVWIKNRQTSIGVPIGHILTDTQRGVTKFLRSQSTSAQETSASSITAFNSTGFSFGSDTNINYSGDTYASWTFRKQPKFFDVVTYTGTGSATTIAHNLGSVPGCIIVKCTNQLTSWAVYHRSLGGTYITRLNTTGASETGYENWANTDPTSTVFTVGNGNATNGVDFTYVAYVFAHNAGGFGLTGTDNVISCGTFTCDGSGDATVSLGYEPQWLLRKASNEITNWELFDNMRGLSVTDNATKLIYANLSTAEENTSKTKPTATGFIAKGEISKTYIYIAIRRGPMKVPTVGTSVFSPVAYTGNGTTNALTGIGFPPDLMITKGRSLGTEGVTRDRLRGTNPALRTRTANAESSTTTNGLLSYDMDGVTLGADNTGTDVDGQTNQSGYTYVNWLFRRAPSYFDEVCYTGTGSATTQTHNLQAVPELMIVKNRGVANWVVYSAAVGNTKYLTLNSTTDTGSVAVWNNTTPTSTVFSIGTTSPVNSSGATYVAYLFATCAGVSKVGSYTGTGTTKQIDCGFTAGARFVLIKRYDAIGDWYVWDTIRGIIAGNDPYLFLNSTAVEVTNTDYIDSYSPGFELSSTAPAAINANGGTYIFLAIA
jgi:hypothetical protein